MTVTNMGEPVSALTSDCGHDFFCCVGLILVCHKSFYLIILDDNIFDHRVEFHLNALF